MHGGTMKIRRVNQNILFTFNNVFPKIMLREGRYKNMTEPDRSQMTIWNMCVEYRIPKSTNTLSEYVIFIVFPQQKLLFQHASKLRLHVALS
jgi:hypothetical protein